MDRSGANPNMQPLGQRGQGRAEFEQQQRSRGSSRGGRGGAGGRGGGGGGRGRGAGRGRGRGGGRGGGRGPPRRSPSTTASMMEKRRKTQMVEDVKKELELLNLEIGDPHMEEKRPPGTAGVPTKVRTNVYGIKMQKRTVFRYDITISGVPVKKKGPARAPPPAKVEFTKRTKDDCVVVDRRDFCRVAFLMYVEKHKDVFGSNPSALYYDLQSILYTLEELNFGPDKSEDTYVLGRDECESTKELKGFHRVSMLVRKVNKVVELDDLSMLSNDMSQQNHTLPQFLELATSQCALQTPQEHVILGRGTTYLIHPENYGFVPKDGPPLSEKNKYLAIGVHKSIRYVEGPDGRDSKKVGLIVESKKTPFHNADANVFEKTVTIIGGRTGPGGAVPPNKIPYLNQQLKNLHVSIQYPNARTRNILVSGVSVKTAANHIIEVQGEKVTVQEYYRRKYGYEMEHPHAPLLTAQEDRQVNFYPMEICTPRDNQRAQLSQLNAREVATMIKSCAVPPPQLKRQIESSVQALDLQGSDYLREAGIEVKKPLVAKGRRLPAPTILFGQGKDSAVDRDSGKWPLRDIFYLPATIQKWAAFLILAEGNRDDHHHFEQEQMDNFIRTFMKMCRSFGMTIPMPCFVSGIPPTEEEVERTIVCARDEACDFVFYITSDAITHLHAIIKASEQKYQIVTQDLKLSNAAEIAHRGKAETVRNIVAKTNEKMGGINYSLKLAPSVQTLIDEGTLFIGLGISHPGAMGNYERARGATPVEPSVIGYAANMKKDPFDFVGDYLFDEPRRDEKFSTMAKITQTCVLRYQEQRSELPRRLILFRNGTSEGQFQTTLQYEVPLVRHALNECAASDCKITVIVTQKMHNIRLFEEPMPAEEEAGRRNLNIKPGTVVDTQVTHPMQNEFYLNSHVAIQGTTRTPRYTILLDDSKFSMDDIEQMCYALSYCYKIINSPTSLPAPVYIALMYAKRGRTIYQANKNNVSEITQANGQPDHEEISHRLGYGGTKLKDNRINA